MYHKSCSWKYLLKNIQLFSIAFFILLYSLHCEAQAGVIKEHTNGLHGYISYTADRPSAQSNYSYGMGFYSAVWPLINKPIADFQIGLAGREQSRITLIGSMSLPRGSSSQLM